MSRPTDEMIEKVLHTRVPGGSEVWHWIEGGGMRVEDAHRRIARVVVQAYIEQTTGKPIGLQDHEARGS